MGDVNAVDVLVIGAGELTASPISWGSFADVHVITGISGISAAKFWLDTHPESQLVILDRDNCIGGTWNSREPRHLISYCGLH
jgi:hypothetical protein